MNIVDVMIHVDETLDHDRRTRIAETVGAHDGVTDVTHRDERPHLMIVKYDPTKVTAQVLLRVVLDDGVHAELVGM